MLSRRSQTWKPSRPRDTVGEALPERDVDRGMLPFRDHAEGRDRDQPAGLEHGRKRRQRPGGQAGRPLPARHRPAGVAERRRASGQPGACSRPPTPEAAVPGADKARRGIEHAAGRGARTRAESRSALPPRSITSAARACAAMRAARPPIERRRAPRSLRRAADSRRPPTAARRRTEKTLAHRLTAQRRRRPSEP